MTDPRTARELDRLEIQHWAPIAHCRQQKDGTWAWTPVEGAPITIARCRTLYDGGHVEMAQKRVQDGHVLQMVYRREVQAKRRCEYFARYDSSTGRELTHS